MEINNNIFKHNLTVITAAILLFSSSVYAIDIRGRVDFRARNGIFPMNGAFVQLCHSTTRGCLQYRTGYDGMYYFRGSPGPHNILVNGRVVINNIFIPNQRYFDINPFLGN